MPLRRDRVVVTTPIGQESFAGWALEPIVTMNIAERTLSGHYRLYGTSKKFRMSVAWTIPLPDARIEAQTDWIVQRLVALNPQLAGTRIVEEVDQADQDVP